MRNLGMRRTAGAVGRGAFGLFAGLLLAASACAGESGKAAGASAANPATVDEKRTDWSEPVTAMWAARAKRQQDNGGIGVLFVGDSITQMWLHDKRYPNGQTVWDRAFAPLRACNVGVAGDRTEHLLWRLREGKMLDGLRPEAVVLMIGVNNLTGWGGRSGGDTPQNVAAAAGEIARELRTRFPDAPLLLMGILPALDKQNPIREKIAQTNQLLAKLADGKTVIFLNFGDKLLAADGAVPKEYFHDGLHLTPAAYAIWADTLLPVLRPLLPQPQKP